MHQFGDTRPLKPGNNNQKLNSVKFFHFNSQWTHSYNQDPKPIPSVSDHTAHTNRPSIQKPQKNEAIYSSSHKKVQHMYDSRLTNNVLQTSQVHPKKKANSQLQSYKKLELSALQNRFSKPAEQIHHDNSSVHMQKANQQSQLIVNSIKLSALKLPQIKTTPKQNQVIKKIKLQNLRMINIQDRIKTMKFTPEKEQNQSFTSQVTTELLRNKIKNISNISKLNKKFLQDRNRTQGIQTQIAQRQINHEPTQRIFRVNKKMFKKDDFEQSNSVPLKKFSKIQSIKNIQHIPQNKKIKTKQNAQSSSEQKQKDNESSLPKIQVYDKKMKIGRKKKSEQNRIRALLLKTLEKTKGTDYVAQQGTSQKNNTPRNSMPQTKRSLSKQARQPSNQRVSLVLDNNNKGQESPNKKSSFKRVQLQKLKKSLNANSQTKQASTYVKNKKFIQMVRQVETRKNKLDELQEIKEEKTLSKEQHQEESSNGDDRPIKISLPRQASSEVSQNQFLPHSARLKLKHQC